jgi:hypothetical protein
MQEDYEMKQPYDSKPGSTDNSELSDETSRRTSMPETLGDLLPSVLAELQGLRSREISKGKPS